MSHPSLWTPARVARLRRLWNEGCTAAEIARRLAGGVTRNAVLGKLYRLGLCQRALAPRRGAARGEPGAARPRLAAAPAAGHGADHAAVGPDTGLRGLASVLSIDRGCRWPLGDPLQPGFSLCGRPVARGAYCAAHAARAYRSPRAWERRLLRRSDAGHAD